MESKNWRVTPGEEPVPVDEKGRSLKVKEFLAKFVKEYGRTPNRHDRLAMRAGARQRNRRATKAGWRKDKREAKG